MCKETEPPNLEKLKILVQSLPPHNLALTAKLFELFDAVAENNMFNQMTPQNIATTNAPNLLFKNHGKKESDPFAATKELGQVNTLVTIMINNYKFLFTSEVMTKLEFHSYS